MAYGFNLGEIQGLTYDIPVINVSIKRGEVSYNYTFTFNDGDEAWVLENVGMVYDADGSFYLTTVDFNEPDVGDEYTVNLSLPEEPTQAFTEAVGMATEAIIIDIPDEFFTTLETTLTSKMSAVISANGKPCLIYDIKWKRESATDQDAFDEFYDTIVKVCNNPRLNALFGGRYSLLTRISGGVNVAEGSSISYIDPLYIVEIYGFSLIYTFTIKKDAITGNDYISCSVIATSLTEITV